MGSWSHSSTDRNLGIVLSAVPADTKRIARKLPTSSGAQASLAGISERGAPRADVVVVGGGPCGSTAAVHLANAGHESKSPIS